jgi:hypothetical protein
MIAFLWAIGIRLERARVVRDARVVDDWQFTKVYHRQAGRWRVVAWHASDSPKDRS